jgi:hypothetical protein
LIQDMGQRLSVYPSILRSEFVKKLWHSPGVVSSLL